MTFTRDLTEIVELNDHPFFDPEYPDNDGNPMSDNTEQFRWIVMIKENLEILFAAFMDVFVAGDLLWYPVEGNKNISAAPDVMVAFGRPKGRRGSYKQWQENHIPPQVAFEILSPSNSKKEMKRKLEFYETYGVEEYYIYDPDKLTLKGWLRQDDRLLQIPTMKGWVSPRMGIRFTFENKDLKIYHPDGQPFSSSLELVDRARQAEQAQRQAEQVLIEVQQRSQSQLNQIVINLLRSGMASQQIAEIAGCAVEQVEALRSEL